MSAKRIKKLLEDALLKDGPMAFALYEYELDDLKTELFRSMRADNDAFIFAVTENSGDVAMVLIDSPEEVYINELARDKLKETWKHNYLTNMKILIPDFAKQLHAGYFAINGVKYANF